MMVSMGGKKGSTLFWWKQAAASYSASAGGIVNGALMVRCEGLCGIETAGTGP
jgi:hypothetical protein